MRRMVIYPACAAPGFKITGAPHDGMAHDILGPLVFCEPLYWASRRAWPVSKEPRRNWPYSQDRLRDCRNSGARRSWEEARLLQLSRLGA